MHLYNKKIGNYGENIAQKYLEINGYNIIEKNFYCRIGEIDIIGEDCGCICFIEVKTRYNDLYGLPCDSITKHKMHKLYKTAQVYILKNKLFKKNFRFDIVEIIINPNNDKYHINLIKNAFYI